jgi:hypothetical protein
MCVGTVHTADDGPDIILVSEVNDLAPGGAPEGVIVPDTEFKGDVAPMIAPVGIGLFDGKAAGAEHGQAEGFLVVTAAACGDRDGGHDRPQEPDLHRLELIGFGDGTARACVLHLDEEVFQVGSDSAKGFDVSGRARVIEVGLERELGRLGGSHCVDSVQVRVTCRMKALRQKPRRTVW